jgi:transcriptional regulator with XRE-family HTH domain
MSGGRSANKPPVSRAGQTVAVDDRQLGVALRGIRVKRGWRQEDLARRAKVSREMIGRIERGDAGSVPLGTLRSVAGALDGRLDTVLRWRGGDLGRLLNARHAAMHEAMALRLGELSGWVFEPEVSFSIYGERGVIDILGWHAETRAILVIELKTEFVDINETMGTLDRKGRLAAVIARERGWDPVTTSTWLVVADGRTNRRALAAHANVLRAKYPADGRAIRTWLSRPAGRVLALSFMPNVAVVHARRSIGAVRKVSVARTRKP